jgi:DNA-binding transcriptional regulator YdaS (Cro superfamily)
MAEMEKSKMEHLIKWFDAKRGRRLRMTEKLNLSTGAISQWKRVPTRHVSMVSKITKIPARALRPDLYKA